MARSQALPKYIQVSEMLIREIAAGHLSDGARLPPERDMAVGLDISVGTLRKALADLEDKGMLERVQGSGNFAASRCFVGEPLAKAPRRSRFWCIGGRSQDTATA